jgi:hypothetical protein
MEEKTKKYVRQMTRMFHPVIVIPELLYIMNGTEAITLSNFMEIENYTKEECKNGFGSKDRIRPWNGWINLNLEFFFERIPISKRTFDYTIQQLKRKEIIETKQIDGRLWIFINHETIRNCLPKEI